MYRYKERESRIKYFFITIFFMVISSIASIYTYKMYNKVEVTYTKEQQGEAIRLQTEETKIPNIANTIEDVSKCIVGISKIKNNSDYIFETESAKKLSLGTGTIISENGYILTNWHLAGDKYSSCYVTLEDGTILNGNTVWAEEDLDLAIVKIRANGLRFLTLGNSDEMKLGQSVYAIGNPIGVEFQRTVTSGIISGLNRTIKIVENDKQSYMEDLIQTDASINIGNSGGPLINLDGEVIGINTVKIEAAEGIGFAVPINIIKPIIESFLTTGDFEEGYLGIFAYDKEAVKYLNNDVELENGIYVVKIMLDGPLAKTNLKAGDIITKIDGNNLNKMSELREYIYKKRAGDEVTLTYLRNNKEYTINIQLMKR